MKTGAMFLISNNMFLVCRVCFIETSKERESAATSSAAAYKKYGVWCVCVYITFLPGVGSVKIYLCIDIFM